MSDARYSTNWYVITPEQFADELLRGRHRSPEQRMCIAHLTDAFSEAIDDKLLHRAIKQQAIDWIAGKIRSRMSFDLCCEALAIDTQWLRERMLKRSREPDIHKLFRRARHYSEGDRTAHPYVYAKKPPRW